MDPVDQINPLLLSAKLQTSEDTEVSLNLSVITSQIEAAQASDLVIGDVLISEIPTGVTLSAGQLNAAGNWVVSVEQFASLVIIPATNSSEDFTLVTEIIVTENHENKTYTGAIEIIVDAVADAPELSLALQDAAAAPFVAGDTVSVSLIAQLVDTDGSESIGSVVLTQLPLGSIVSDALLNADGSWSLLDAASTQANVILGEETTEDFILAVQVSTQDIDTNTGNLTHNSTTGNLSVPVIVPEVPLCDFNEDDDTYPNCEPPLCDNDPGTELEDCNPAPEVPESGQCYGQGYWKTHSSYAENDYQKVDWPAGEAQEDEDNLICERRWIDLINHNEASADNWTQLGYQWMAARLNVANGGLVNLTASQQSTLQQKVYQADVYMNQCAISGQDESDAQNLKDLLESFNNSPTCQYVEPCEVNCDDSVKGGHIDVDTDSPYGPNYGHRADGLGGDTDVHEHKYDDDTDRNYVDYLDIAGGSRTHLNNVDDVYFANGSQEFIVLVANADLSPGAAITIGAKRWNMLKYQKLIHQKLAAWDGVSDLLDEDGDSLIFTTNSIKAAGTLRHSFDDQAIVDGALHPTETDCIRGVSRSNGRQINNLGRYRNGALIMQLVKRELFTEGRNPVEQLSLQSPDDFKSFMTLADGSLVQLRDNGVEYSGLLVKNNAEFLYESALFWHFDQSGATCYGDWDWADKVQIAIDEAIKENR